MSDKSIADSAYEQYPRLRSYGFQFIAPTDGGKSGGRYLETYPADERDNPMPGKPTIQQFDATATPEDFMGETLHILPKIDPYVGAMRQQFIDSMTLPQRQKLMDQYDYAKKNFGEKRPYEDWESRSGLDAWFRGNITGQFPADIYTPQQTQIFDKLRGYLQEKP